MTMISVKCLNTASYGHLAHSESPLIC